MTKGLHNNAYGCRDSEETRAFYEDFLELILADTFPILESKTGRKTSALHSFCRLGDNSFLAFFEVPATPYNSKEQLNYGLHVALKADAETLQRIFDKGKQARIHTRGVADHRFIRSIYFRDPNGYVIELTTPSQDATRYTLEAAKKAHGTLAD